MAVYTVLDEKMMSDILKGYDIGSLLRYEPISSGIENTNYFVWAEKNDGVIAQWVLTIFENLSETSLPFFNDLTIYLSDRCFAVPAPVEMKSGQFVFSINHPSQQESSKYGVIVPKFSGSAAHTPDIVLCQRVAIYTAKMHKALNDFVGTKNIQHSLDWCEGLVEIIEPELSRDDVCLLRLALARYQRYQVLIDRCSQGVVHGDLFRDNVLFDEDEISGVIDFYNAGKTAFLFDLAVIANDWAVDFDRLPSLFAVHEDGKDVDVHNIYDEQKLSALVHAYESEKPFSSVEREAWPRLLELAAFRFWLSRLKTKYIQSYQQESKAGEVIKSPDAMKVILLAAMER